MEIISQLITKLIIQATQFIVKYNFEYLTCNRMHFCVRKTIIK